MPEIPQRGENPQEKTEETPPEQEVEKPQEVEQEVEEEQYSAEMKEILEKIDFDKLKGLFLEVVSKHGIDEKSINFLGKDRIRGSQGDWRNNYYHFKSNTINLEEQDASNEQMQDRIESLGGKELHLLRRLVHEETHAVIKNRLDKDGSQNGYTRSCSENEDDAVEWYSRWGQETIFKAFNEGVVDKLSREILLKYAEQTSQSANEVVILKKTLKKNSTGVAYAMEVKMVDTIIKYLAKENKVTKKKIWDLIVEGLVKGEVFEDSELTEYFSKAFGPGFVKDLARVNPKSIHDKSLELLATKYGFSIE